MKAGDGQEKIASMMDKHGLDNFASHFEEEEITELKTLFLLTDSDLEDLGLNKTKKNAPTAALHPRDARS